MEFWLLFLIMGGLVTALFTPLAIFWEDIGFFPLMAALGLVAFFAGGIGSLAFVMSQHSCLGAASNYGVKARYPSTLQGCFWQDPQSHRFITESQWKQIYLNDGKGYTFNIKGVNSGS
jgi:hypothetical protein